MGGLMERAETVALVALGVILAGAIMHAFEDVQAVDYARNGFDY